MLHAGTAASTQLWQVQLAGLGQRAFTYKAMISAKEALPSYSNGSITTLQELEEREHIRLAIASSPPTGPLDVDKVGMVEWQIAFYAAAQPGICKVLGFIHHVLNHKVQQGQLREVPPLQVFACPGLHVMTAAPPSPWTMVNGHQGTSIPKPFAAAPPRGKRHIVAQLERHGSADARMPSSTQEDPEDSQVYQPEGDAKYILTFLGGLFHFRLLFDNLQIAGGWVAKNDADPEQRDYVRYVEFTDDDASKAKVGQIFSDALLDIPVFFVDMVGPNDPISMWLLGVSSVIPGETPEP